MLLIMEYFPGAAGEFGYEKLFGSLMYTLLIEVYPIQEDLRLWVLGKV